ncbi:MAG: IS1182 family transposase [Bacteroidales bacterium]
MKMQFKSYDQDLGTLFPSYIGDKIARNHPVRLISSIVDSLDLTTLQSTYKQGGCPAYNPRMLLKIIFYAYLNNIYSCRKIEEIIKHHIHYMWLSGGQEPSFSTINRFRSEHMKDCINDLFSQVVKMLVRLGQISLEVSYIDGTKIESVANKYTFVWRKSVEKNKEKLQNKINNVLQQIDEGIAQDNSSSPDGGTDIIDSKTLREEINKINKDNESLPRSTKEEKKEAKRREKLAKELDKHQQKLKEYEQHEEVLEDRNSYSKTDKDATFMRMKEDAMNNGQTKPGYNLQIGTENQYITNVEIYSKPNDTTTLPDFLEHGKMISGAYPKRICADSGYGSEENYERLKQLGIEAYVKYNWFHKEQHRPFLNNPYIPENLFYNEKENYYVCPMGQHMTYIGDHKKMSNNGFESVVSRYEAQNCNGCPLRSLCYKAKTDKRIIEVNHKLNEYKRIARELLNSEEGLMHRSKRPIEPEAVFGQIKFNKQYKRFRHKGKDKVYMDFVTLAISFNLQKLLRKANNELISLIFELKAMLFLLQSILKCSFKREMSIYSIYFKNYRQSA